MSSSRAALVETVRRQADATAFNGVVCLTKDGARFTQAWGLADRERRIAISVDTRFGLASGTKGFTAAAIACLVDERRVALDAPARDILRSMVPRLPADVTIRHLLTHTSGIGDYYDEEAIDDAVTFAQSLPLDRLQTTADYLPLLDAAPRKFSAGERFSYCNSGFVVLALVMESVSGRAYHDFVDERVFRAAGMTGSGVFRYDSLPPGTAIGYVERDDQWQDNRRLLPVRGGGDGGAFATLTDLDRFWDAWLNGRIASPAIVDEFLTVQVPEAGGRAYGCGFWLNPARSLVYLEGSDPGISFRSLVNRANGDSYTVVSNTTPGAWPLVRTLDAAFTA